MVGFVRHFTPMCNFPILKGKKEERNELILSDFKQALRSEL